VIDEILDIIPNAAANIEKIHLKCRTDYVIHDKPHFGQPKK